LSLPKATIDSFKTYQIVDSASANRIDEVNHKLQHENDKQ